MLIPHLIENNLLKNILSGIKNQKIKKQENLEVIRFLKCVIISYNMNFLNYNIHFSNPESLLLRQPSERYPEKPLNYDELSNHIIDIGIMDYFLSHLKDNILLYNMINSSIMSLVQLTTQKIRYNPLLKYIREYRFEFEDEKRNNCQNAKQMKKIQQYLKNNIIVPTEKRVLIDAVQKNHERLLEEEEQEKYLLDDETENKIENINNSNYSGQEPNDKLAKQEEELLKMREELKRQRQKQEN